MRLFFFFLQVPGHFAIRMMPFVLNVAKKSTKVRDMTIEMLRKAMYKR